MKLRGTALKHDLTSKAMSVLLSFCKYYDHIPADVGHEREWRKCSDSVWFQLIFLPLLMFYSSWYCRLVPTALGWTSCSHIPILPSMAQAAVGISTWGHIFSLQQHKIQSSGPMGPRVFLQHLKCSLFLFLTLLGTWSWKLMLLKLLLKSCWTFPFWTQLESCSFPF